MASAPSWLCHDYSCSCHHLLLSLQNVLWLIMCLQDWAYLHKEHGLSTFLAVRIADAHGRPLGVLCLASTATCAYQEEWCVACAAVSGRP
jgi:hypothetical protein